VSKLSLDVFDVFPLRYQLGSCSPDGNVEQMLNLALELLDEVKPRSPVETLLLVQMTSLHTVGLDLLRRANTPNMTPQREQPSPPSGESIMSYIYGRHGNPPALWEGGGSKK